jgi:murein L,D-transpeptidase YcbB/YkuD
MKWVFVPALVILVLGEFRAWPQSTASKSTAKTSHRSSKQRRKPHAAAYQLHPDPERYQEIQKALSDKGYFKGEVNGQWTNDSADALKRFQADQKLEPDGKINALTLSALGLGAKHDGGAGTQTSSTTTAHPPQ